MSVNVEAWLQALEESNDSFDHRDVRHFLLEIGRLQQQVKKLEESLVWR